MTKTAFLSLLHIFIQKCSDMYRMNILQLSSYRQDSIYEIIRDTLIYLISLG